MKGERGLLIKTLFQTGARVSEFVNLKVEDVFFEEQMILIAKVKGGKSRYVPLLPELAQELRTHLGPRMVGGLDHGVGHFRPLSITRQRHLLAYHGIAMSCEGLCQVF
jgi:integrase/recombinase XerD